MASVSELRSRTAKQRAKAWRISLNDGQSMPLVGLGVWQIADETVPDIIEAAIDAGYSLIDTAADYGNETGVGQGIARAPIPRDQLFVTTKVRNNDHGYDETLRGFDQSAARLGLDIVDLLLVHWPCPQRKAYVQTWRALIELQKNGRVRSIGVSNFNAEHLDRIINETGVVPAVNQIELHPVFQQRDLRSVHAAYGIVTQAWSPLGRGGGLSHPTLQMIARKHGRTPAQIVLRWNVENGVVTIPKTATPSRLAENIDVFDFELSSDDHAAIALLARPDGRFGPDPATYGRERFLRRALRRVGL
jgi:2,5-diketo-D-gluconate reductase A